ncbi:DUF4290 domain-containing protein [Prevotella sp. E13-17]|uniref:DUF4290 domain-containing protein n=1 Tax=Prevotella sp. E13-17 TaxID=2913616 RepID=UPI001EDA74AA|nr:DUF4290 domain-containing protein [Prevotella sp. E13-17]UKK51443.1 DUF4290 domain-containing protein [Prevotella sp. E13-17]
MEIKGLDYNTQREPLLLPEYGREIQKMVDHAVTLPTREERLRCAKTIVRLMETKIPHIRDNADYKQALWDHLYLMSHKQLDIDWPFDISNADVINAKPKPMAIPQEHAHLRHYGHLVEELFEKLKTMEPGEKRDELTRLTAYQMKRDLALWGRGSMDNEKVADDLARFTDGVIQIDLSNFTFNPVKFNEEPKRNNKRKK